MAGKNAQDGFNRFVEGGEQRRDVPIDESKKDFWDSFSNLADERAEQQSNNSIGTNAMGMGKSKTNTSGAAASKKKDEWDDW